MSLIKKTFPINLTVFVNKCGTIGLNLIPMLLVEKSLSATDSSLVMSIIKFSSVGGTFLGSFLCDYLGMKFTLLLSFFLGGLGLGLIPFFSSVSMLTLFASISQIGHAMFGGPMRLLVSEVVTPSEQQEAWGWFRVANNVGQIVSYTLGTLLAGMGVSLLMYFDCVTSFVAVLVGIKIIKEPKIKTDKKENPEHFWQGKGVKTFLLFALVTAGFSLLYDLFIVAVSANCKIIFKEDGIKVFSQMMLLNTVLCALVAVPASKQIKNPKIAIPLGIVFLSLGSALTFWGKNSLFFIFLGMLIVSLGEIFYTALATFVLIRVTPQVKKKGTLFGLGLTLQPIGRIIGSALAFPFIVHGENVLFLPTFIGLILLAIAFSILPEIMKILKEQQETNL